MYDPRDDTRSRKQPDRKGWVQDLVPDNSTERTVGRNLSESMEAKSTSAASNVPTKKTSANSAADTTYGKEESEMSEMQELGKLINRTVEASNLKIEKQIGDLQNGYIRRNNDLYLENTDLKAKVMFFEKETERYEATKAQNRRLKKILFWIAGGVVVVIIIFLLLKNWGWV